MVTTYTLKNILENKDFILEYYKNDFKNYLKNIDDFIDYIFLNVILKFKECLELLKEELKNELIKFLSELNDINENVSIRSLVEFLIDKYDSVFHNECNKFLNHDIKIWYIELCLKYPNVLKENKVILEKLIGDETILFFDYYPQIKKKNVLSLNLKRKFFLEDKKLEEILKYRSEEFFKFILPDLEKEIKDEVFTKLYDIYDKRSKDFFKEKNQNFGWSTLRDLELLYPVYFKSKNHLSKKLLDKKKKIDLMLNNLLIENKIMKPIEFRVSSKEYLEYLEKLRSEKISSNMQYLTITHFFKEKLISKLENSSKNYKKSFMDFASSNIKTNDVFTAGKIFYIDNYLLQECINLTVWLCDKNRKEFINNLLNIVKQNYINLSINILEEEVDNDLEALNYSLTDIFSLEKNHSYNYFTCTFFIISLLEKILRNIYIKIEKDGFFNSSSATYGLILKSNEMSRLIGNETINWLKYYLIGDEEVGENYRNRIAHFTKIKINDISQIDLLKILYLFVVTVNSIFINSAKLKENLEANQ